MTPRNRSQRGFISFSTILGLVIVVGTVFTAIRLLPPYIANYQLQDSIDNIARTATYSQITDQELKRQVMRQASDLGIQVTDRQVIAQKSGGSVNIAITYEVPVNLLARQVVLKFAPAAGNRNITAR